MRRQQHKFSKYCVQMQRQVQIAPLFDDTNDVVREASTRPRAALGAKTPYLHLASCQND